MEKPPPIHHLLIDADDSNLIVIDVQDTFLHKLPHKSGGRLLNNICWLVETAQWLNMPLVITAEELDREPVTAKLIELLPDTQPIFNKLVFGLADQDDIMTAVAKTGRKTAVLIGLETDVCVMQSALGLLARGYRVVVVSDATGTPSPNHEVGLNRMREAGVIITNMKGLFYEWMRTVEQVDRFHHELPHMRASAGVTL